MEISALLSRFFWILLFLCNIDASFLTIVTRTPTDFWPVAGDNHVDAFWWVEAKEKSCVYIGSRI